MKPLSICGIGAAICLVAIGLPLAIVAAIDDGTRQVCIKSHMEEVTSYYMVGKTLFPNKRMERVCDREVTMTKEQVEALNDRFIRD